MAAIDRIEGMRLIRQGLPLTARQASAIIGCSKSWLLAKIKAGAIPKAGQRGIRVMIAAETVRVVATGAGVPIDQSEQTVQSER